jgi:hypothetical protein
MGITVNSASRLYVGQKEKRYSDQANLEWENFPYTGLVKVS